MKHLAFVFVLSLVMVPTVQAQSNVDATVTTTAPTPSSSWTVQLKSEASNNLEVARTIGGSLTENQFRLAYKFNDKANVGLLWGAKYKLASDKEIQSEQGMINSDTAIAGFFVAPSFVGSDKTEIDARFYLPTSEEAKVKHKNYVIRTDVKLPYSMESERVAALIVSPRFTDNDQAVEQLEVLSQIRIGQGKTFIPYAALNHRFKMLGETLNLSRTEEYMGPEVGVEMIPHKMVKLAVLVSQERNILNPSAKKASAHYSVFDRNETKYLLGAQIKM